MRRADPGRARCSPGHRTACGWEAPGRSLGELVGLLGPNGAGKTTLLSLVEGLRRPDSGTVRLFGRDPRDAVARVRLGSTPQETGLPPSLKVREVAVLNGTLWSLLGLLPPFLVAVLLTEASAPAGRVIAGVVLVLVAGVPFLMIGLSIGYLLSAKAAVAVAQVVVFPLAFAGGLFLPPEAFPAWLDGLSTALPSRAARDLVVVTLTGGELPGTLFPCWPPGPWCSPWSPPTPIAATRAVGSADVGRRPAAGVQSMITPWSGRGFHDHRREWALGWASSP